MAVSGYEHLPAALQKADRSHAGHSVLPHEHVLMDAEKIRRRKPCSGRFFCQSEGCMCWFTGPLCRERVKENGKSGQDPGGG